MKWSYVLLEFDQAIPCGLILNELVTNALKYAYPGGKAGEIKVDLKETPSGSVTLTVADQRIGLPEGSGLEQRPFARSTDGGPSHPTTQWNPDCWLTAGCFFYHRIPKARLIPLH